MKQKKTYFYVPPFFYLLLLLSFKYTYFDEIEFFHTVFELFKL